VIRIAHAHRSVCTRVIKRILKSLTLMEKVIRQFDSAVGISLDTGWAVRVSNPGKGERFFFSIRRPYRLWGRL
jgi:hypothetical protein